MKNGAIGAAGGTKCFAYSTLTHMKKDGFVFQQRKVNNNPAHRGQILKQNNNNHCKKKKHFWNNNCWCRNKNRQNGNGAGPSVFSNALFGYQNLNIMVYNPGLNSEE